MQPSCAPDVEPQALIGGFLPFEQPHRFLGVPTSPRAPTRAQAGRMAHLCVRFADTRAVSQGPSPRRRRPPPGASRQAGRGVPPLPDPPGPACHWTALPRAHPVEGSCPRPRPSARPRTCAALDGGAVLAMRPAGERACGSPPCVPTASLLRARSGRRARPRGRRGDAMTGGEGS